MRKLRGNNRKITFLSPEANGGEGAVSRRKVPGRRVTNSRSAIMRTSEVQKSPHVMELGRWTVFVVMRMRESSLISKI